MTKILPALIVLAAIAGCTTSTTPADAYRRDESADALCTADHGSGLEAYEVDGFATGEEHQTLDVDGSARACVLLGDVQDDGDFALWCCAR